MSESTIFPIKANLSIIPPDFQCDPQDMHSPEFAPLKASGCVCCFPVRSPSGWKVVRKWNSEPDHIDLFFITSGSVLITTAEGTLRAGAGQSVLIISWVDRILFQDEPSEHIYFRFDNPKQYPGVREITVRDSPNVEPIAFYTRMLRNRNHSLPEEAVYRAGLVSLIHILVQRELRNRPVSADFERAELLQTMLSDPSRKDFEASSVAREFGMSFSNFRIFCRKHFSKPPRDVIEEARMLRARGMLDYSVFSIDEIAERLGYADRFTFGKAFQRSCGMPPAAFRKRPSGR